MTFMFVAFSCVAALAAEGAGKSQLGVASFCSDVTPPVGHPMNGGYSTPVKTIEDRLEAKGVILQAGQDRYVLCAVDWCGLSNTAYAAFRDKIAAAAGTDASRVALHCLHQHTAVLADGNAQRMLADAENPIAVHDPKFLEDVTDRLAEAVKASLGHVEPFNRVGFGQANVDRVASSRRIIVDGKLRSRMSATEDAELRALPEGTIDPTLKTITLAQGDRPLVRVHYYATHPQSFYGDGRVSSDVPGLARKELQKQEKVPQIYFTGCGGDVAMGKYNNGTRQARDELTARLLGGMKAAVAATRWAPVERIVWRTVPLRLPLRNDEHYNPAGQQAVVADAAVSRSRRIEAAEYLAFARRIDEPILVSSLQIGQVYAVHLPGEAFIEYQLYAQRVLPDRFVAVAAYGEYDPVYIPTERAFQEGGYEPTQAMAAPQSETVLKQAIRQLLGIRESR